MSVVLINYDLKVFVIFLALIHHSLETEVFIKKACHLPNSTSKKHSEIKRAKLKDFTGVFPSMFYAAFFASTVVKPIKKRPPGPEDCSLCYIYLTKAGNHFILE